MKYHSLFTLNLKDLLPLLAALLLMTGCARTVQVSYYQLSATAEGNEISGAKGISDSTIGIGPVSLPEYLDRPQIVVRQDTHQLHLSDSHRWVEPLAANISRVLRENFSVLLNTEQLLLYPWNRDSNISYQISIDMIRFDGEGYGEGHLEAVWSITDSNGKKLLPQKRSKYIVATTRFDHEGLVEALSKALHFLSREIAQELLREAHVQE